MDTNFLADGTTNFQLILTFLHRNQLNNKTKAELYCGTRQAIDL